MAKASLFWVDLEMTGLDPVQDRIIEVGVIATDWEFREVARYEAAVRISVAVEKRWLADKFWETQVSEREALRAKIAEFGKTANKVEGELLEFLDKHFATDQPIYLAGNSIHQDQKFIERQWPRLNARLHYRQLDVSSWKIVFENRFGKKFVKPERHRAISDIEGSIAELKYYLKNVKC